MMFGDDAHVNGQRSSVSRFFAIFVLALLCLAASARSLHAVEVNAGEDQVVAMNDLAAPDSPVDPNLLQPTHPAWPFPFATDPESPVESQPVVVKLNGSHTGDDQTPVTVAWSVTDVSQAAYVSIDDVGILDPNVTFTEPNLYSLTLTADDGVEVTTDTINIKVKLVENGLQAHWKFDGDPNDLNDFDWHYTTFTGSPDFGPGVVGDALMLDKQDSVSYGNVIGAETSISVAFWMNPSAEFESDSSQGIVRKYSGTSSDPQGGWTFQMRSETELRWRCSSGWDNGAGDLKVVKSFPVGTWTHVVGTYDGQTGAMKFYLNGQLAAERNASDTCFDEFIDEMTIGSDNWAGMIDDLYVFDYPLDIDEIRPLVAKGLNVAPSVQIERDQVKIVQPVNEVHLAGTVVEEGPYAAAWEVVDGPAGAEVQILSPDALATAVRLDSAGNYRLRLTVTDEGTPPLSDSAEIVVKVRPADFDGLEAHVTFADLTADSRLATSVPYVGELFGNPTYVEGLRGEGDFAILLDGVDDHINYDAYLGSDPCCTIALWVGNDAIDSDSHIIQKWASDASGKGWMIRNRVEETPGQIAIMIGSGFSGAGAYSITDAFIPAVQWTHIALTFDGSVVTLYLNGNPVFTHTVENENFSPADLATPTVVGYRWNNESRFLMGVVDEIRVYDYALTPEALLSLYQAEGGQ